MDFKNEVFQSKTQCPPHLGEAFAEVETESRLGMIRRYSEFGAQAIAHIEVSGPGRIQKAPVLLQSGVRIPDIQLIVTQLTGKAARCIQLNDNDLVDD